MKQGINMNLEDLANGAIKEKLQRAYTEVANNILDPNTDPNKARKVTITMSFKPDDDRDEINVDTEVRTNLAPQVSVATTVLMGRNSKGQVVANELLSGAKGQSYFDPDDGELKTDTGEPINDDGAVIDYNKAKQAKEAK